MKYCLIHKNRKVFSKGLCAACYKIKYYKPLKRTPLKKKPFFIKPIADKHGKNLRTYGRRKDIFLFKNPLCKVKGINCTIKATEVHHKGGKEGKLLLDESKWLSSCHNCHIEITEHSKQAIKDGHSISRHKN